LDKWEATFIFLTENNEKGSMPEINEYNVNKYNIVLQLSA
jgi:hypothetical protein